MTCKPNCCIFVPLYKLQWSPVEISALSRCLTILRPYHFIFAHKSSHNPQDVLQDWSNEISRLESWSLMPLEDVHLSSISHYNSLMLSIDFYRKLDNWTHVLVFQLDAWILGGNLDEWLIRDYTYVGAPWCPRLGNDQDCRVEGVGNGGLSLRNVVEMVQILNSPRYRFAPVQSIGDYISEKNIFTKYRHHHRLIQPIVFAKRFLALLLGIATFPFGVRNNLSYYAGLGVNEDVVLGVFCPRVFKWMRMPSVAEAAHFSLETNAKEVSTTFSVNVPFACHAWERRDKYFFVETFPSCFSSLDLPLK